MVENLVDLGNASTVLNAVLTGSGLKLGNVRLGEAAAPGDTPGAGSTIAGVRQEPVQGVRTVGDISTASSPLPADTPTPKLTR